MVASKLKRTIIYFKNTLTICLFLTFDAFSIFALRDLLSYETTFRQVLKSNEFSYPSFTICGIYGPTYDKEYLMNNIANDSLSNMPFFITFEDEDLEDEHNNLLELFDDKNWKFFCKVFDHNECLPCVTFNAPPKTSDEFTLIYLHFRKKDQFPNVDNLNIELHESGHSYGMKKTFNFHSSVFVTFENDRKKELVKSLQETEWDLMSNCTGDPDYTPDQQIEDKIYQKMGCIPGWSKMNKSELKVCKSEQEIEKYFSATIESRKEMLHTFSNCRYKSWTASHVANLGNAKTEGNTTLSILLMSMNPHVGIMYVYDKI